MSTRGRGAKIRGLLESLAAIPTPSLEIVIVDQSDDDATSEAVAPYLSDSRLRYVRSRQMGASRGRNLGVQITTAPLVCITDDDCIVPPDWPARMCEPFENPRVGAVWCSVVPLEARSDGHTPNKVFANDTIIRDVRTAWRRAESGFNLGAGFALRRVAFAEAGGFDDYLGPGSTFPSAEDNDLAWRCLLGGWWVYELSTLRVIHDGFRTMDESKALARRDFRGIGGASAKYLRTGHPLAARLILLWTFRFWVTGPVKEVIRGRRPTGIRRPLTMWGGLLAGLRRPVDRRTMTYR